MKISTIPMKETIRPKNDGALNIRRPSANDREKLRDMFDRLSEKSIHHRFHMPYPSVPEWMAVHLSKANRPGEGSLVAVAEGEIIAHAMYVVESLGEAEMAVMVEDRWQSRGVGKLLLFHLALEAKRRGVETFTAVVLGENRRMLGLLDTVFANVEYVAGGGAYKVRVPLSALKPVSKLEVLDAPNGESRRVEAAPHQEIEKVA
ncbi:MAG: GNAT family N-acetyltransferase [Rubrobacteraceae bacterium]